MTISSPEPFANHVKRLRLAAGLSQEELAERAGLSTRAISDLERGLRAAPRLHTLRALADALALPDDARAGLLAAARPRSPTPALGQERAPRFDIRQSPLNRLVGREEAIQALLSRVVDPDVRLITLTGPGGVGKTRLAGAVATRYAAEVLSVDLAPVTDPAHVGLVIAQATGARIDGDQDELGCIARQLHGRPVLLVLDNFEQVMDAAQFLPGLLQALPDVTLLVTSRIRLNLRDETEYPVLPLAVPEGTIPEELERSSAVALFSDRVRASDPGFSLSAANAAAVARICRHLDGLPLALELAAARSRVMDVTTIAERLAESLPLLAGGPRDLPARQQTIRNTIAWSYDLLPPRPQQLLRWLSVFLDGATLQAAEHVATAIGMPPAEAVALCEALIDSSLLRRTRGGHPETRYSFFEPVREFGLEQLEAHGEREAARASHAAYYLALAEYAESEMYTSVQRRALDHLEAEHPNLREAFQYFAAAGDASSELRLGAALNAFWWQRGHMREGVAHLRGALGRGCDAPPRDLARAAVILTGGYLFTGDLANASALSVDAVELARAAEDDVVTALSLAFRAAVVGWGDDPSGAREALPHLEEGITLIAGRDPTTWVLTYLLQASGIARWRLGEPERGVALIEQGVANARAMGDLYFTGSGLWDLGFHALQDGNVALAARRLGEATSTLWELRGPMAIGAPLAGLTVLAADGGRFEVAGRLLGSVTAIQERTGIVRAQTLQQHLERAERTARAALDESSYVEAFEFGRNRLLADAVAEAIALAEELSASESVTKAGAAPQPRPPAGQL